MSQDVTASTNTLTATGKGLQHLTDLLACPACGGPLTVQHCAACNMPYPTLGGVPWLFANPKSHASEWRNRWHRALRALASREQAAADAARSTTSELTRTRLQTLQKGCSEHRQSVQQLLAPLEIGMAATEETYIALGTPLPEHHGLFSYAPNLFRDWSWGSVENRGAINALLEVLERCDASSPRRIAVLGSGAGRLAFDLHAQLQPIVTAGIEINPYLAFAAASLCAGNNLRLTEFPMAPRTASDAAVSRTLQCPDPQAADGLVFVAADALQPPFQSGSFDLVITPWFSDVCGATPHALAAVVNDLLTDGGTWLNHGSVAFDSADPEHCLGLDEFIEQVCEQGFDSGLSIDTTLPYMQSPSSRHGRVEQVNTVQFKKHSGCAANAEHPLADPPWLGNTGLPVPHSNAFKMQSNSTAVHAFLMSLIDGQRSIDDMAGIVADRGMMPAADAQQALRGFMTKMHSEAVASNAR